MDVYRQTPQKHSAIMSEIQFALFTIENSSFFSNG